MLVLRLSVAILWGCSRPCITARLTTGERATPRHACVCSGHAPLQGLAHVATSQRAIPRGKKPPRGMRVCTASSHEQCARGRALAAHRTFPRGKKPPRGKRECTAGPPPSKTSHTSPLPSAPCPGGKNRPAACVCAQRARTPPRPRTHRNLTAYVR